MAGALRVKLCYAVGLRSMDSNGYSDPYVKLTLGNKTHKSKTIKKTLNPRWDETFSFRENNFGAIANGTLQVDAWDWDMMSRNDALGSAQLQLGRLMQQGLESGVTIPCSVQLKDSQATPGEVFFEITWEYDNRAGRPPPSNAPYGQQPYGQPGYGGPMQSPGYGAGLTPGMAPGGRPNVPARVVQTFQFFDTNRSGYLDYAELRNALRHYGIDANTIQSAEIVRRYDDRPDGKLELAEFGELIRDLEQGVIRSHRASTSPHAGQVPARVAAAFDEHDTNRSGFLDYAELRGALRRYGLDTTEGEAASIVRAYDDRPDGKLDVYEFSRLVKDIESGVLRREGQRTPGYQNGYGAGAPRPRSPYAATSPRRPGYGGASYSSGTYGTGYGSSSYTSPSDERGTSGLLYLLDVLFRTVVYALATAALVAPNKIGEDADLVARAAGKNSAAEAISGVPYFVWYAILALLVVFLLISINCCGLRRPVASCFDCAPGPCSRFCHMFVACCRPSWGSSRYGSYSSYDGGYSRYGGGYANGGGGYGGSYAPSVPKAYERL